MERRFPFYRGCLLGLAIGDAMGYPVDSKNWEEIQRDYGPGGLLGYDLQHDYADITSYTQLAVFAANGLLAGMTRARADKLSQYLAAALREWAKGQQYRSAAENIAMGYRTAEAVVKAWMNSPSHRANILSTRYDTMGIGFADGYWAQWFIR